MTFSEFLSKFKENPRGFNLFSLVGENGILNNLLPNDRTSIRV